MTLYAHNMIIFRCHQIYVYVKHVNNGLWRANESKSCDLSLNFNELRKWIDFQCGFFYSSLSFHRSVNKLVLNTKDWKEILKKLQFSVHFTLLHNDSVFEAKTFYAGLKDILEWSNCYQQCFWNYSVGKTFMFNI